MAEMILRKRKVILLVFAILLVFSCFSMNWVRVEENTVAFLNDETQSKQCLDLDEEEFQSFGSIYLMAKHLTDEELEGLRTEFDGSGDIYYYTEALEQETEGDGQTAVFYISLMWETGTPACDAALDDLIRLIGQYDDFGYYSDAMMDMDAIVTKQMTVVILVVGIAVLLVLLTVTKSFGEIAVLLPVFIVSAIINMGTNFLLGTVSLISYAVAVTLQLALSMDYAIIFCSRYREAHETMDYEEAACQALKGATPEILASSLTTIAGLLAMTFMTFRLGADLGFMLMKAIAISMLTVFLLMPALLILLGPVMDRTEHRQLLPRIGFVGRYAFRTRRIIPLIFFLVVAASGIIFSRTEFLFNEMKAPTPNLSESSRFYNEIVDQIGMNKLELLVPAGNYEKERSLIADISSMEGVKSVSGIANTEAMDGFQLVNPVTVADLEQLAEIDQTTAGAILLFYAAENGEYEQAAGRIETYSAPLIRVFECLYRHMDEPALELSEEQRNRLTEWNRVLERTVAELQGERFSRIALELTAPLDSDESYAMIDRIYEKAAYSYGDTVHIAGASVIYKEFEESFAIDKRIISILSILLVLPILLFSFRRYLLPILLVLLIQGSIWINFSLASVIGSEIYFICYLLVSSIMMGSNIDYAIVISSRYFELRKKNDDRCQCMIDTLNFAFPTIMTSGGIMVLAGLLIRQKVSEGVVAGFGGFLASGTFVTMLLVLFALPQVLLLFDGLIEKTVFRLPSLNRVGFRQVCACILIMAGVMTLIVAPMKGIGAIRRSKREQMLLNRQVAELERMEAAAVKADSSLMEYDYYGLVEAYLTDQLGWNELENAKQELESGEASLNEGLEAYADGESQYDSYLQQYLDGKQQLEEGQQEYDANYSLLMRSKTELASGEAEYQKYLEQYRDGKAEYEAGLEQYEQYLKQYQAGKAEYEAGKAEYEAYLKQYEAGKAEYEAGRKEYEAAKAELEELTDTYNMLMPLYSNYRNLQNQYDAAVAAGQNVQALTLSAGLSAAKSLLETELANTGYSISGLVEAYEDGKAQLANAEAQLADAETQLAEAENMLADGKAELERAEKELADAEKQLADARTELDQGKAELADAEKQLEEGKEELDAGRSQIADGEAQLEDGKQQLESGYAELAAAESQLQDAQNQLESGKAELESGEAEISSGQQLITDNEQMLSDNARSLSEKEKQLAELMAAEDRIYEQMEGLGIKEALDASNREGVEMTAFCGQVLRALTEERDSVNTRLRRETTVCILLLEVALVGLTVGILLLKKEDLTDSK